MTRVHRRLALAGAVAATSALTPGVASATPPSGVSATTISQRTFLGLDYIEREITIQPGGSTGWHWHDGTLYAYARIRRAVRCRRTPRIPVAASSSL
jgi:hypothetical protein